MIAGVRFLGVKGKRAHKDALTQETVHVPVTLQKLGFKQRKEKRKERGGKETDEEENAVERYITAEARMTR